MSLVKPEIWDPHQARHSGQGTAQAHWAGPKRQKSAPLQQIEQHDVTDNMIRQNDMRCALQGGWCRPSQTLCSSAFLVAPPGTPTVEPGAAVVHSIPRPRHLSFPYSVVSVPYPWYPEYPQSRPSLAPALHLQVGRQLGHSPSTPLILTRCTPSGWCSAADPRPQGLPPPTPLPRPIPAGGDPHGSMGPERGMCGFDSSINVH